MGRPVDYGNWVYRVRLGLAAKVNPGLATLLGYLCKHYAENFDFKKPDRIGQGGTLDLQGDVIEISMSAEATTTSVSVQSWG